jgi:hypothetical protein
MSPYGGGAIVGDTEGDELSAGIDVAAGKDVAVGMALTGVGVKGEPALRIGADGTTDALHAASASTSSVPAAMSVNRIRSPLRRHLDGYADVPAPSVVTPRSSAFDRGNTKVRQRARMSFDRPAGVEWRLSFDSAYWRPEIVPSAG